ncbi:hypothetical protein HPB50_015153 [Hyalomma asiaticum]|uniref:Uncharacterized protein n=1 Tax=Hyalomma asiaticum TaxID=266040 RepID=A0ACB7T4P1_HYAAI|nr:hypothetical protein HPB50_015153 [Hyalomma asiaticum]
MERVAERDLVRCLPSSNDLYSLAAVETLGNLPESAKAPNPLSEWLLQVQKQPVKSTGRNLTKQPAGIPEPRPSSQRWSLSAQSNNNPVCEMESVPSHPPSLASVKEEPTAGEALQEATMSFVPSMPLMQMLPSPIPTASTPVKSAGKKRKPKTQANTTVKKSVPPAQLRSMQPSKTQPMSAASSVSVPRVLELSEPSAVAHRDGIFIPMRETLVHQGSTMDRDMDNITGYPTPIAHTEMSAMTSIAAGPTSAFGKTRPLTQMYSPAPVFMSVAQSSGAVRNEEPSLGLSSISHRLSGFTCPSIQNVPALSALNEQAQAPAAITLAPPAVKENSSAFSSSVHRRSTHFAKNSLGTTRLENIVSNLTLVCHEEDAIRLRMSELDQSIASALATLQALKKKREELKVKEIHARKKRLELLQRLQGVTLGMRENATDHTNMKP